MWGFPTKNFGERKKGEMKVKKETKKVEKVAMSVCPCGCNTKVRRTFAPGHDSKVHGMVNRVNKGEIALKSLKAVTIAYINANKLVKQSKRKAA